MVVGEKCALLKPSEEKERLLRKVYPVTTAEIEWKETGTMWHSKITATVGQ